jgi:hypothetical protein
MPGSPASLLRRERGTLPYRQAKAFPEHDHDAADCCGPTVDKAEAKALLGKASAAKARKGAI